MTKRPVYTVLHTPITMCFVERKMLFGSIASSVLVGWFGSQLGVGLGMSLVLAMLSLVIGYGLAFWMRDDPTLLSVMLRAMRTRTHYDHAEYQPVKVEIR